MKTPRTLLRYPTGLVQHYETFAFVLGHTVLLVISLNLLLAVAFRAKDARVPLRLEPAGTENTSKTVYPGMSPEDVAVLLGEMFSRHPAYEPFTGFRERPFSGRYVNVHEAGFRLSKRQGPWPPDPSNLNVFVFGGSTTFGYGVADDQTIASFLGERLSLARLAKEPRVYNFGRAAYYSTQERILFERLVSEGIVPDLALFIDGLNDSALDTPAFSRDLTRIFDTYDDRSKVLLGGLLLDLPLSRAISSLRHRVTAPTERADPAGGQSGKLDSGGVIARYLANKVLLERAARRYGISVAFVWQPTPAYKYDLRYHPFWKPGYLRSERCRAVYAGMADLLKGRDLGRSFLWCADLQEGLKEPLYVTPVHYSPGMSERIAMEIARLLVEKRLVQGAV